jgi:flagellar basal-body rod modification protein FlgD
MTMISPLNYQPTTSSTSSNSIDKEMDKQAFLNLLVTQLRNQDPLSPMDNKDFIAQLAQFTSLENLQNIYEEMDNSNLIQQSTHNALSTSLIGKYSLINDETVMVDGDQIDSAIYVLPEAGDVKIDVVDENGQTIRSINKTGLQKGEHLIAWDGQDQDGNTVSDGAYTIKVEYTSAGQTQQTIPIYRAGLVNAVRFVDGSPVVMIEGDGYLLSDILEVMDSLPKE